MNNGNFADALDYLRRAQKLTPPYSVLLINLAIAENATGESAAAEQHFKEALRLAPLSPGSYTCYARYLLAHSRAEEAGALLHRALELNPGDPTAREVPQKAKTGEAEAHAKLGDALLTKTRFGEAIAEYERALEIAPDLSSTLNNFAWLLATCPEASLRNVARAVQLANKADQVAGGKSAVLLRTLAAALAENGRFIDAIETAQRARQLALAENNFHLVSRLDKEVDRYRHNLPLHR